MAFEVDVKTIDDFFQANGYNWSLEVIDRKSGARRDAKAKDFSVVDESGIVNMAKMPILIFGSSAHETYPRSEEFALGLLVTESKFELYEPTKGKKKGEVLFSLYDDELSFGWQTFQSQRT